jgi:SAM-dependent methyltransferase
MSDDAARGQVTDEAAEVYDRFFVPALFGQWPERLLDAGGVRPGHRVLDIGCGTGAVARAAAERVGPSGAVVGVDRNAGMLAVARRAPEAVTWQLAVAERLPLPDASFDRVVCAFALMFLDDAPAALREMARVLAPGGTVVLATWAAVGESPGYAAMVELLRRTVGDDAAEALLVPFRLGTPAAVAGVVGPVFPGVAVTRHEGTARFDSLAAWLHTDVRGWTLADAVDDELFAVLRAEAEADPTLAAHVDGHGRVRFAAPALVAVAPAGATAT